MTNQLSNTIDTLLAASFKELAVAKPIEKITIREITDRAGVIRPTFYNHFQDKYELVEWIVKTELIDPMKPLLKEYRFKEALDFPFDALLLNREYYTQAAKLIGQNSFEEALQKQICALILECVSEEKLRAKLPYEWLTPQRTANYFAATITVAIMDWIRAGMDAPKDEFIEAFLNLCFHSIEELVTTL